jgi:hypothetical protein
LAVFVVAEMSVAIKPAITDSPWFWVLAFSLMALLAVVVISGKYGRRQANIERQYQARERIAEDLVAANNQADVARLDGEGPRREFATPANELIPLWPLAAILVVVAIIAGAMLCRCRGRPGSLDCENQP